MHNLFAKFAVRASKALGAPWTFFIALGIIIVWAITGPIMGFSETWQLIINTGTTIITFLMVFIIQNTQNRDAKSMELKLNELIRATKNARTKFIDLEEMSEKEMERDQKEFRKIAKKKPKVK